MVTALLGKRSRGMSDFRIEKTGSTDVIESNFGYFTTTYIFWKFIPASLVHGFDSQIGLSLFHTVKDAVVVDGWLEYSSRRWGQKCHEKKY